MLVLQPNDRYEYAGKLTFTGPHKHDVPLGSEPPGDECAGCYYVAENADIEVRSRAGAKLNSTLKTDARAELASVVKANLEVIAVADERP